MAQKAIDENLAGVAESDAVRAFVQRADKDQAPETLHRAGRLMMPLQPVLKRRILIGRHTLQARETVSDAELFTERQVMGAEETAGKVQGRRPALGAEGAHPAIGRHEVEGRL